MERKLKNKPLDGARGKQDTSWQKVAGWYDNMLETDTESYQAKVILPNILRLMDLKSNEKVIDVACGQGFFSREIKKLAFEVVGIDLSKDLIEIAKSKSSDIKYFVAPADKVSMLGNEAFDKALIVLALQNIKEAQATLVEISRVLKSGGRLFIVLNHPVFRIPKASGWGFDETTSQQYRRIDAYMSESSVDIDMHPGKENAAKTISFHRPLQWYFKAFNKAGFSVARLEEWISHKESQKGPKKAEEDRIRKEIPLFMCVEVVKN